jgi:hypothetical protein
VDITITTSVTYEEDMVFVAKKKGIGHIPDWAWRAANPKDALLFLT